MVLKLPPSTNVVQARRKIGKVLSFALLGPLKLPPSTNVGQAGRNIGKVLKFRFAWAIEITSLYKCQVHLGYNSLILGR